MKTREKVTTPNRLQQDIFLTMNMTYINIKHIKGNCSVVQEIIRMF